MRFGLSSLMLVLLLAGCGAAASGSGGGSPSRISSDLLREADPEGLSVLQIIQRHRPQWLRESRGAPSFGNAAGGVQGSSPPRVVLDGVPWGEVGDLRSLPSSDVRLLEFLDASDATTRFGTGYAGGAILVSTR